MRLLLEWAVSPFFVLGFEEFGEYQDERTQNKTRRGLAVQEMGASGCGCCWWSVMTDRLLWSHELEHSWESLDVHELEHSLEY